MARDPLKLWFCHILSISTTQACMHAKMSKNKALELQNPPRSHPEPSKIEPGAHQDAPKSAERGNETPQKPEQAPKKRPRTNKCANMSQLEPTWHPTRETSTGYADPPLCSARSVT